MAENQREQERKKTRIKFIVAIVCAALLLGAVVGGVLGFFTDSDSAKNSFTVGKVKIELNETDEPYKMVPGTDIHKDPVATVIADSEDCWLFVELKELYGFGDKYGLTYDMADGWNQLTDGEGTPVAGVYYREVPKSDTDNPFQVLKDNKVIVPDTVTKADMEEIEKAENKPTLTVTAYAVQKAGIGSAKDAWTVALTGKLPEEETTGE